MDRTAGGPQMGARIFFGLMALAMLIPLVLIVSYVVDQGLAAALLGLPHREPAPRRRAPGGIWSALVGTIYIVFLSLAVSAPVGVLAAVYLNEYAKDNWFTASSTSPS
jgi:phosphate transport system permease protein